MPFEPFTPGQQRHDTLHVNEQQTAGPNSVSRTRSGAFTSHTSAAPQQQWGLTHGWIQSRIVMLILVVGIYALLWIFFPGIAIILTLITLALVFVALLGMFGNRNMNSNANANENENGNENVNTNTVSPTINVNPQFTVHIDPTTGQSRLGR